MSKLNEVFNIEPVEVVNATVIEKQNLPAPIIETSAVEEIADDYNLARQTLRTVITKGEDALEEIIHLAKSSEHPRSYEVAGQLMKTMAEVAKDLLALQKQKQEIVKPQSQQESSTKIEQQNNIVFAGSTEDLMKMIKKTPTGE
jgi:dTDP-4-dehydrorhamnose reductase